MTFSHFHIAFLQAGICISPVLRGPRANAHLLVKFNAWMSRRLLNWNPIPKLTIILIWKTPACLKFVKTCNGAVENLPQRKLWVRAANYACSHPPNFIVLLFELFLAQCILVKTSAVHSGCKKWWIQEFVPPYIFPLNLDNVAACSVQSLCSKKNYKPKGNVKGKKTMLPVLKHGWVYNKMKIKYQRAIHHVLENISNSSANHSKFQSGNKKPWEISKEV